MCQSIGPSAYDTHTRTKLAQTHARTHINTNTQRGSQVGFSFSRRGAGGAGGSGGKGEGVIIGEAVYGGLCGATAYPPLL